MQAEAEKYSTTVCRSHCTVCFTSICPFFGLDKNKCVKLVGMCILDIDQSHLLERKISTWLWIHCARVLVFKFGLNLYLYTYKTWFHMYKFKVRIQNRQCLWTKTEAFLYHHLFFFDMGICDPIPVMADDITAIAPPQSALLAKKFLPLHSGSSRTSLSLYVLKENLENQAVITASLALMLPSTLLSNVYEGVVWCISDIANGMTSDQKENSRLRLISSGNSKVSHAHTSFDVGGLYCVLMCWLVLVQTVKSCSCFFLMIFNCPVFQTTVDCCSTAA